ncbi:hypothetical protein C8F01DRAFT_1257979 [Mycena amicta]|nr:hypothetical protein C8F01DRAFT_1257979 [Mycena amicta]
MTDTAFSRIPAEIWLHIHGLATVDCSPVALAHADEFRYQPIVDPFSDIRLFWRDARSFALVNKQWNILGTDLLYGCVSVDKHFDMLHGVLARHGAAKLVRAVRLSSTRFDRNRTMLAWCPAVQIIVLPDVPPYADLPWISNDRTAVLDVKFPALKYIYWNETETSFGLLRQLVSAAPRLEGLFLADSEIPNERANEELNLPSPIPSLRRLSIANLGPSSTDSILNVDLHRLTSLTCTPTFIPILPNLPSLQKLHIFRSRGTINFNIILGRCPRIDEISLDVWNGFTNPPELEMEVTEVSLIRVHSAVYVVREWSNIQELFATLTSEGFPLVRRVVLHNTWHRVIADPKFVPILDGLRGRGCHLEFPEGHVLSWYVHPFGICSVID